MKLLVVLALVAIVSARPRKGDKVPGEYSVLLKPGVTTSALGSLLRNAVISSDLGSAGKRYLTLRGVTPSLAARIAAHPLVRAISQSRVVTLDDLEQNAEAVAFGTPGRPDTQEENCITQNPPALTGNIWHLARVSSTSTVTTAVPYRFTAGGSGSDVYILDTGIDTLHPEFGGRAHHYFVSSGHERQGPLDQNGHGTHVAGLAGGAIYGVAKTCSLYNVKVLANQGWGSVADITEGIVASTQRAILHPGRQSIINMSLGGEGSVSPVMREAVIDAINAGVLVLAAAGNEGQDTRNVWPASFPEVIAVGATTIADEKIWWSNYGPATDVNGPGVTLWAAGSRDSNTCGGPNRENCYVAFSGTSMSCPVVAGVAARHPTGGQNELRTWLSTTGSLHGQISMTPGQAAETPNRLVHLYDC